MKFYFFFFFIFIPFIPANFVEAKIHSLKIAKIESNSLTQFISFDEKLSFYLTPEWQILKQEDDAAGLVFSNDLEGLIFVGSSNDMTQQEFISKLKTAYGDFESTIKQVTYNGNVFKFFDIAQVIEGQNIYTTVYLFEKNNIQYLISFGALNKDGIKISHNVLKSISFDVFSKNKTRIYAKNDRFSIELSNDYESIDPNKLESDEIMGVTNRKDTFIKVKWAKGVSQDNYISEKQSYSNKYQIHSKTYNGKNWKYFDRELVDQEKKIHLFERYNFIEDGTNQYLVLISTFNKNKLDSISEILESSSFKFNPIKKNKIPFLNNKDIFFSMLFSEFFQSKNLGEIIDIENEIYANTKNDSISIESEFKYSSKENYGPYYSGDVLETVNKNCRSGEICNIEYNFSKSGMGSKKELFDAKLYQISINFGAYHYLKSDKNSLNKILQGYNKLFGKPFKSEIIFYPAKKYYSKGGFNFRGEYISEGMYLTKAYYGLYAEWLTPNSQILLTFEPKETGDIDTATGYSRNNGIYKLQINNVYHS